MEVSTIKKALRTHRMESAKNKIDFADISTFDIVPTPPKGPKPETARLQRRHRVHAQKLNTYEAKYGSSQDSETHKTQHDAKNGSGDFRKTVDPAFPWYCPTPRTGETSFDREENAIRKQATCNAVEATFTDQSTNSSRKQAVNANPIRYPAPGPREQLAPSPFPVNKNKLAPVVNPKKNAVPKPARAGPRPVKAKHMLIHKENVKTTVTDQPTRMSLPEAANNTNPIRYPAPGPREQLAPSPFPVNKNILAPMVDPRKNAIPKSARPGPRPVKAVHMPVFHENTESSSMLTMMYGCRDVCVADSVIPVKNRRPIRNPSPGPREQLLPSIFPTKKRRPATLVKRGRVVAPMCG
ncbi:skin secretory protein xP2-like [Mizuhopecten yessoensis]|uniref:skin secretory protein xP2-like n=1 Tax=Mizuhopecten yessoensis TaxID=6573 RepID=UPI000B45AE6A|nr:skin secretory protein xP2-like [Mizuhopecten yessoensis]